MLYQHTKAVKASSAEAQLECAIMHAEETIRQATDAHYQAFKSQMREKLGVDAIILREPYLENTLAWFSLKYIQRIESLRARYIPERKSDDDIPDITEAITKEASRITDCLKQRLDETQQQSFGITHYVWHTREDDKVRPSHQANDGKIFAWDNPPATGNPGDEFGCRCWAEPTLKDVEHPDAIEPVYPIEELIVLIYTGGLARRVGMGIIRRLLRNREPVLSDTSTWPKPPRNGKFTEGIPSRTKPAARGEKSLYDEAGGEWRYAPEDSYHNPHWDYKPSGKNEGWQNIPIDGLPILK